MLVFFKINNDVICSHIMFGSVYWGRNDKKFPTLWFVIILCRKFKCFLFLLFLTHCADLLVSSNENWSFVWPECLTACGPVLVPVKQVPQPPVNITRTVSISIKPCQQHKLLWSTCQITKMGATSLVPVKQAPQPPVNITRTVSISIKPCQQHKLLWSTCQITKMGATSLVPVKQAPQPPVNITRTVSISIKPCQQHKLLWSTCQITKMGATSLVSVSTGSLCQ